MTDASNQPPPPPYQESANDTSTTANLVESTSDKTANDKTVTSDKTMTARSDNVNRSSPFLCLTAEEQESHRAMSRGNLGE